MHSFFFIRLFWLHPPVLTKTRPDPCTGGDGVVKSVICFNTEESGLSWYRWPGNT
jgi:hypothetical protein